MAFPLTKISTTGNQAIASTAKGKSGGTWVRLVTVHLSAAPAQAGSLTITLDAIAGPAYDVVLHTFDFNGKTDMVYMPEGLFLDKNDEIKVEYANPDGRTYGCQIALLS